MYELISEACIDANGVDEQLMGFHCQLEEHLSVPFQTEVLGLTVTAESVKLAPHGITAVCVRSQYRQSIHLLDLPLPKPPPDGWQWIEAYRQWSDYAC